MTPTVSDQTGYRAAAAELHRIADAIEGLPGAPRHMLLDFQTSPDSGTDDEIAAGVDAVAVAILGEPGKDRDLPGGRSQRHAGTWDQRGRTSFAVSIYQMYPEQDPRELELRRLQQENADLRAQLNS